jgi:hypothetical protein
MRPGREFSLRDEEPEEAALDAAAALVATLFGVAPCCAPNFATGRFAAYCDHFARRKRSRIAVILSRPQCL